MTEEITWKPMNLLCIVGDLSGCLQYRITIPHNGLRLFSNFTTTNICFMPRYPGVDPFSLLVQTFSGYSAVVVQRCYLYSLVYPIAKACEFLGIPLIFETDDDYLHLLKENPAYYGMIPDDILLSKPPEEELEATRRAEMENYKRLLELPDLIICSTEELKQTLLPYNNNVKVLQNNVETTYPARDVRAEQEFIKDNSVIMDSKHGLYTAPAYFKQDESHATLIPRVGYTGTPSHRGLDWTTIAGHYPKVIQKLNNNCRWIYIGDDYFANWHNDLQKEIQKVDPSFANRLFSIPPAVYDLYMFNLRNLDIGMAPLFPSVFNMSKSDIKAVELGAWGIPCVLPKFVTYSRNWVHNETALLYSNGKEFIECMEALIMDKNLRDRLGQNAHNYVSNNRLERQHSEKRYRIYEGCIASKRRLPRFQPNEVTNVA